MHEPKKKKNYTKKEALIKIAAYCAYQERNHQEVRSKLFSYGLEPDEADEIIIQLSAEKLLDEERYAKSYVRGKYSLKRWGRRKILQGLKAQGISDYCVRQGLKEIDAEVYEENLKYLLDKKDRTEKEKNPMLRKHKLAYYLMSKGYENDLVQDALKGQNS
jgi:regulatory protein